MRRFFIFPLALFLTLTFFHIATASLVISSAGTATVIDFDTTVVGSNNGQFAGAGFDPSPAAGQLDSDAWSITDMGVDVDSDDARLSIGTSTGVGVTTGGVYAFTVATGNNILGFQPRGSFFTPGTVTLKINNDTGFAISDFDVDYDIYTLNDGARTASFNFSYSTDGTNFTNVSSLDYATPAAADVTPVWSSVNRNANLVAAIGNPSDLYLRWSSDDNSISGSGRDLIGLDNLSITLNAVPEPASSLLFGVACCTMVRRRRRLVGSAS